LCRNCTEGRRQEQKARLAAAIGGLAGKIIAFLASAFVATLPLTGFYPGAKDTINILITLR
jgi:hypothetical protein